MAEEAKQGAAPQPGLPEAATEAERAVLASGAKLMFDASAYVEDVNTALSTVSISKFDRSREGSLSVGDDLPDIRVHAYADPDMETTFSLLPLSSLVHDSRPLVITPRKLEAVFEAYTTVADFAVVYIMEAHPTDEWKLYTDVCYEQPKTIAERMDKAKMYKEVSSTNIPMFVDTMDNAAEAAFAAWPERLYIIQSGKVVFKGEKGPDGYSVRAVEAWLQRFTAKASVTDGSETATGKK